MSDHTVGRIVFSGHSANQALNRALSSESDAEIASLKAEIDRLKASHSKLELIIKEMSKFVQTESERISQWDERDAHYRRTIATIKGLTLAITTTSNDLHKTPRQ